MWSLKNELMRAQQEIRNRDELISTFRQRLEAAEKQVAWLNENLKSSFDKQNFEKAEWKKFYLGFQQEKDELNVKLGAGAKALLDEQQRSEQQKQKFQADLDKMQDQIREMTSSFILEKSGLEKKIEDQEERLVNQENLIKDQDELIQDLENQIGRHEHVLGLKEQELQELQKQIETSEQEISEFRSELRTSNENARQWLQASMEIGEDYALFKVQQDEDLKKAQALQETALKEKESELREGWAAWEQSEADNADLAQKLEKLEQSLKEKDEKIRVLRHERSEAVVLSKNLTRSFNEVQKENADLQKRQAHFEDRCEALHVSLEQVEAGLAQREESRENSLKQLQEKLSATSRELSRAEQRRQELEGRIESMIESGQQRYGDYVNEAQQLREELQAVSSELHKELELKKTLQAGFTHLQSLNEKLVERLGLDGATGHTYKKINPDSVESSVGRSEYNESDSEEKNISKIRRLRT